MIIQLRIILIWFFCFSNLIYFTISCSNISNGVSKPNLSIIDKNYIADNQKENNANFKKLKAHLFSLKLNNAKLAYELGKIPELQDSITNQELLALEAIIKTFDNYPKKFGHAFEQMNHIGLINVRRFNAPLQALFWLFLDGYSNEAKSMLLNYKLKDLLREAWVLEHNKHLHQWRWRTEEAKKLYNSCIDLDLRKKIVDFYTKNKGATDYIISLSLQYPLSFKYTFRPFSSELKKHRVRWDEFNEVVDRVNSPELVHYYIMSEFSYGSENQKSPEIIFHRKSGGSSSMARFGEYLLKKAGYNTFIRKVVVYDSPCAMEHTGAGIVLSNGSYLLVIDFPKGKTITGPFDEEALIRVLSKGHCLYPDEMYQHIPEYEEPIKKEPFGNKI